MLSKLLATNPETATKYIMKMEKQTKKLKKKYEGKMFDVKKKIHQGKFVCHKAPIS